jgi:hypothetical protein
VRRRIASRSAKPPSAEHGGGIFARVSACPSGATHLIRSNTDADAIPRTIVCVFAKNRAALTSAQASYWMMVVRGTASRQQRFNKMKKPVTAVSILLVAALTMGVAVAQRMEHRAQQDRFSFGAPVEQATQ